ncbi:MAG: beta-ribofuranosylaminobenzene 5'-phosphate synthase family protein [Burkholderiales bacterium]
MDTPVKVAIKSQARYSRVDVAAPVRLHLGFMDLSGATGRSFGSLGLTLEGMSTRVHVEPANRFEAEGEQASRAERYWRLLQSEFGLPDALKLVVAEAIPEHVGLGSGTQLALAVGTAATRLFGQRIDVRTLARILDRGARSGIGIGAFEQGGFLVDGGTNARGDPPPVTVRMEFPTTWRVLLIFDRVGQGIHGASEIGAFRALPPYPEESAARLCRLVLMRALPALAEADITEFGAAITDLQRAVGDYFAPAQGGRYASPEVAKVLAWLEARGVAGFGQSSWGPTGFAVLDSETAAQAMLREADALWGPQGRLHFAVCTARNRGGEVVVQEPSKRKSNNYTN